MEDLEEEKKRPQKGSYVIEKLGVRIGGRKRQPRFKILKAPGMRRVRVPLTESEIEEKEREVQPEEAEETVRSLFGIGEEPEFIRYTEALEAEKEEEGPSESAVEQIFKKELETIDEAYKENLEKIERKKNIYMAELVREMTTLREMRKNLLHETVKKRQEDIIKRKEKVEKGFAKEKRKLEKRRKHAIRDLEEKLKEEAPRIPIEREEEEPESLARYRKWERGRILEEEREALKRRLGPRQKVEKIVEYEEEKVELTPEQRARLKKFKMKLPPKFKIKEKIKRRRTTRNLEITHDIIRRAQIGPFGIYLPFKSGRKVKPLGNLIPKRKFSVVSLPRQQILAKGKPLVPRNFTRKTARPSEYYGTPVTQEIRDAVVELIFELIAEKRIPITGVGKEKMLLGQALIPGLIRSKGKGPPEKISRERYINQELSSIAVEQLYPELREKVPEKKLREEVKEIIKKRKDVSTIIKGLESRIDTSLIKKIWAWDAQMLWKRLQDLSNETELEFILRVFLKDKSPSERREIRGKLFRNLITKAISLYRDRLTRSEDSFYNDLEAEWLRKKFIKEYRKEKPKLLEQWRDRLDKAWEEYSRRYDQKYEDMAPSSGTRLTPAGQRVYSQIQEMEQRFFDDSIPASGNLTLFEYLQHVLYPTLFLDTIGDIGRYAKFFQTKLQSGSIEINALPEATISHYLPEVIMRFIKEPQGPNSGLNSPDLEIIQKRLSDDLRRRIDEFISLFQARKGIRVSLPPQLNYFPWREYVDVPQDICFEDTGTGYSYTRNGRVKIPDSDLVICYSDTKGFTCYSIRQIAWSIVRGEGDPITGEPYPESLVKRMKRQHPEIFKLYEEEFELFNPEGED